MNGNNITLSAVRLLRWLIRGRKGKRLSVYESNNQPHDNYSVESPHMMGPRQAISTTGKASITILAVNQEEFDKKEFHGFSIDGPRINQNVESYLLRITGWVLGKKGPAGEVRAKHLGVVLRSSPLTENRNDVARTFRSVSWAGQCGFSMDLSVVGLPNDFILELAVVPTHRALETDVEVIMGTMRCRRVFNHTNLPVKRIPILVTHIGRTGSTYLMNLLRWHPEILSFDVHPFELTYCSYWMHTLRVLTSPGDHVHSSTPYGFHKDFNLIGHNPFNHPIYFGRFRPRGELRRWLDDSLILSFASCCQQQIDVFYDKFARELGKENSTHFLEKTGPNHIPWLCHEFYHIVKEIIMVRDFRDWAYSSRMFFRPMQRQDPGLDTLTDEEWIHQWTRNLLPGIEEAWRLRGEKALLVKYEDLVLNPLETLMEVLEYLGLDASSSRAEDMYNRSLDIIPESHRTSKDPRLSIGRWKRDLDNKSLSYINKEVRHFLTVFGYES